MREASSAAREMATQLADDGRDITTILTQIESRFGLGDRLAIEQLVRDRLRSRTLRERVEHHSHAARRLGRDRHPW